MSDLATVKDTEMEDGPVAIVPEALYTPREVARILRFGTAEKPRVNSVYQIPETLLPKVFVGPNSGRVRYLGRDLLRYVERCRKAAA